MGYVFSGVDGVHPFTATILEDASVSEAIETNGLMLSEFQMPDTWTTASIGFDKSDDAETWYPAYDAADAEISIATPTVHRIHSLGDEKRKSLEGSTYIRIRSGSAASPVAQGGDREFVLKMVDPRRVS